MKDGGRKPSAKAAPSFKKGIIAGLVVVIGAGVVFWYIGSKDTSKPTKEKKTATKQIAEVKPQIVTQAVEEVAVPPPKSEAEIRREREKARVKAMTQDEREEYIFNKQASAPLNLSPSSNRVFATGTEQVMSMMFTKRLGDPPPPLPAISIRDEAHLAEIIINNVQPNENDSENVRLAKESVDAAKRELAEYLKEGGDIHEFLKYYHDKLSESYMIWKESQQAAIKVCREDPELAPEMIRQINQRLDRQGIKNVEVPIGLKKQAGIPDDEP